MPEQRPAPPPCLIPDDTITTPRSPLSPITFFFFLHEKVYGLGEMQPGCQPRPTASPRGFRVGKKAYNLGALEMSTTLQPSPPFYVYSVVVWSEGVPLGFGESRRERIKASTPRRSQSNFDGCDFRWPLWVWFGKRRGELPIGRGLPPWMRHGGAHPTLLLPPP